MTIRRVVSDLHGERPVESRAFYEDVIGLELEQWGVRRFFVRDPNGAVINVMQHL